MALRPHSRLRHYFQAQAADEFRIEIILKQKLTPFRMALSRLYRAAETKASIFAIDEYDDFIHRLMGASADPDRLDAEYRLSKEALITGKASRTPDIKSPETQLVWAATLLYLHYNWDGIKGQWRASGATVSQSPLWRQVRGTPYATEELLNSAGFVAESLRRGNTKFRYGGPNSGFKFEPDSNVITIDLILSLIGGFEQSRGFLFQEIGRSQQTTRFPKAYATIRDEMLAIKAKTKNGAKLSAPDYKRLRLLGAEWTLRYRMFNAAENNCLNRYVSNKGNELAQDYGHAVNHFSTTVAGYGEIVLSRKSRPPLSPEEVQAEKDARAFLASLEQDASIPDDIKRALKQQMGDTPQRRFDNLVHAMNLLFFANNNYFNNTRDGWEMMGVNPDWIRVTNPAAGIPFSEKDRPKPDFMHEDFAYLATLCGGPEGLEHLQPKPRDRWKGAAYYNRLTDWLAERRCAIIEHIWDLYFEADAKEILKYVEKQVDDQLKQKQRQKGQKGDGQNDDDQDQEEGQEGEEGQDGQDGEPSKKKDKKNEKKNKQTKQGRNQKKRDRQEQDGQEQDGQDDHEEGENGQRQKDRETKKNTNRKEKNQESDPSQEQDPKQSGRPQEDEESDPDSNSDNEGAEEKGNEIEVEDGEGGSNMMPDVDVPPDDPKEGNGQDRKKNANKDNDSGESEEESDKNGDDPGEPGKGKDKKKSAGNQNEEDQGDDSETIQELVEKVRRQRQEASKKPKQDDKEKASKDGTDAGKGTEGKTLDELARKADWADYPGVVAELQPTIAIVARLMKKIQERQLKPVPQRSRHMDILPEDNEFDRLNRDAHMNLVFKKASGQRLEENDLKRFVKNNSKTEPALIDFVLNIDGSHSMETGKGGSTATPLEISLLSSVILYEAAKKINANVYIILWGSKTPLVLAKPGDDPRTIGKNIVAARSGLNSGTDFAPSFKTTSNVIANDRINLSQHSGITHMLVFSDGDVSDAEKSKKAINAIFTASNMVTLDFVIIREKQSSVSYMYAEEYSIGPSAMERLADTLQATNLVQKIGVTVSQDTNFIPVSVITMLLDKLKLCQSFLAQPRSKKRNDFKRAGYMMD